MSIFSEKKLFVLFYICVFNYLCVCVCGRGAGGGFRHRLVHLRTASWGQLALSIMWVSGTEPVTRLLDKGFNPSPLRHHTAPYILLFLPFALII